MVFKSVYRTPTAGSHTAEKGKAATVSLLPFTSDKTEPTLGT